MPIEEIKRALIVVRTYPTPAKSGAEVSCTAAITDDGQFLRLFPVPWRYLPDDQRFRKYQWVELTLEKSTKDARPESYKLKQNGIKILRSLSTVGEWQARKNVILPLKAHCLCCLMRERDSKGYPTLGIFRPRKIESLVVSAESPEWSQAQLAVLQQGHLFEHKIKQLEKIPFKFQYRFWCEDERCNSHTLMCADWEMAQSWRKWHREYGSSWEEKFRYKYEREMIEKYDTHFYVGTVHKYPGTWIIVGLFYPPKSAQSRMFDS